jgi:hypothetical protein
MYKTHASEHAFKDALRQMSAAGMTLGTLQADSKLYESFACKAYDFTKNVVVKPYINIIRANPEIEVDAYIDDILFDLIISKLDYLLALVKENQNAIGFIIAVSKNMILYANRQFIKKTRIPIRNGDDEAVYRFISTEEAEWELPAAPPADEPLIIRETQVERLAYVEDAISFFCELPRFDITCLLGTKVLRIKATTLAANINETGLVDISNSIFQDFLLQLDAELPSITMEAFGEFKHDRLPAYNSLTELSAYISKASYAAQCALARKMGVQRKGKSRAR